MAWIAVDRDGSAFVYVDKPVRAESNSAWKPLNDDDKYGFVGMNARQILTNGKKITWESEPIEIKL